MYKLVFTCNLLGSHYTHYSRQPGGTWFRYDDNWKVRANKTEHYRMYQPTLLARFDPNVQMLMYEKKAISSSNNLI